MDSDLQSTRVTSSGSIFDGPGRVRAIALLDAATAGTISIRDGGASGTVLMTLDTPGDASGTQWFELPGNGIRCQTSIYAEFDQAVGVTVFYS